MRRQTWDPARHASSILAITLAELTLEGRFFRKNDAEVTSPAQRSRREQSSTPETFRCLAQLASAGTFGLTILAKTNPTRSQLMI
jgi:hypothetical protein